MVDIGCMTSSGSVSWFGCEVVSVIVAASGLVLVLVCEIGVEGVSVEISVKGTVSMSNVSSVTGLGFGYIGSLKASFFDKF